VILGRTLGGLLAAALAAIVLAGPAVAQLTKPNYLPFAEFTAGDSPERTAVKRGYNDAVNRYNQALYEYHVTLENHDRLVDAYNGSTDPAERKKVRDEAEALRARLATLRREVTNRAAAVDQAARRAAAAGVSITR
jgi:hypothetical protein